MSGRVRLALPIFADAGEVAGAIALSRALGPHPIHLAVALRGPGERNGRRQRWGGRTRWIYVRRWSGRLTSPIGSTSRSRSCSRLVGRPSTGGSGSSTRPGHWSRGLPGVAACVCGWRRKYSLTREIVRAEADLTVAEVAWEFHRRTRRSVSPAAMGRTLEKLKLTRRKDPEGDGASRAAHPAAARALYRLRQDARPASAGLPGRGRGATSG